MEIKPSIYATKWANNWENFYFLLGAIPLAVITTIVNIRANPELTEVPEGYEPRHWEYFKHPLSRWIARYLIDCQEKEYEMFMSMFEMNSQDKILYNIAANVETVMKFYNDHRSIYFRPFHAEGYRYGREQYALMTTNMFTDPNLVAYNPVFDKDVKAVPYDGYVDPKVRP